MLVTQNNTYLVIYLPLSCTSADEDRFRFVRIQAKAVSMQATIH